MVVTGNDFLKHLRWTVVTVPFVLVITTAQIRSVIRNNDFFSWENLYLGVDLCIAGLAVELVEITDLLREHAESSQDDTEFLAKLFYGLLLAFGTASTLLVVSRMHQKWDRPAPRAKVTSSAPRILAEQRLNDDKHRNAQVLRLGVAANICGVLPLIVFIWLRLSNRF